MRRLERLHAITNHLRARSPRTVSTSSLAERFGVSKRTIERDLHSLDAAGVPVYGVAGRTGGYGILPEHSMPPIQLGTQEAAACAAALTLMDRSPLALPARTALDKLRATLPASMSAAEQLGTSLLTVTSPRDTVGGAWLDAVHEQVLVELTYADDPTTRVVEPYVALQGSGAWYLIGWCRTKDGVRGFRTDRVHSLRATRTNYDPLHSGAVAEDLNRWSTQPLI